MTAAFHSSSDGQSTHPFCPVAIEAGRDARARHTRGGTAQTDVVAMVVGAVGGQETGSGAAGCSGSSLNPTSESSPLSRSEPRVQRPRCDNHAGECRDGHSERLGNKVRI